MSYFRPRIAIAGLRGGSGKTILSLGLAAAWLEKGIKVAPFKKGPDFIDAGWLAFAAGRPCYNLDPFLMSEAQILESFLSHTDDEDLALVEGNRGLFDGLDVDGCCSTAELARLIKTPVVLILDVTMATRSVAAILLGCRMFDPQITISGVILNRVGGERQETLIRDAIEKHCGVPVVGAVPKLKENPFPERHMGLVPYQEREQAEKAIHWAKGVVEAHLELDEIRRIAREWGRIEPPSESRRSGPPPGPASETVRIGYVRDKSFWFYYPENLAQLKDLGATLVEINAIEDEGLPPLDALYIGGGFPETQAEALSANRPFRNALREQIEEGLPVYAECGGLMFLGEELVLNGKTYPMVGALPIQFHLEKRPQGHGYTIVEVDRPNPFHPVGAALRGHEFHYSRPVMTREEGVTFAFQVRRGHGLIGKRDGICRKNLLATYTHLHAAGCPDWSRAMVDAALRRKEGGDKIFPAAKKSD